MVLKIRILIVEWLEVDRDVVFKIRILIVEWLEVD